MFSFLKPDPIKKLQQQHRKLLEQAMHAQRNGDLRSCATITAKAEAVWTELQHKLPR